MIMKKWHSYFSKILFFRERSATIVNYTSEKARMFIPFFTVAGFDSSSSELDSSELDSSFFAGGFLAGVTEISQWDDHEKVAFLFFKNVPFSRSATSINYTSEKAGMFIPFFTVAGFASSSSELDSSELDSSFFAGGFLAGVAEISQWDDYEKLAFLFFKNSSFSRKACHQC